MIVISAASETVTSQGWWTQVVSIVVTVGAVAAALYSVVRLVYRFVPGVKSRWERRKERRKQERRAEFVETLQPVLEATVRFEQRLAAAEHLGTRRHQQTLDEIQEIGQRVGRVEVSQKEINRRIDRHTDEEREERQADRAELLGWLNVVGAMRRDDMQLLRDRRSMAVEQAKEGTSEP